MSSTPTPPTGKPFLLTLNDGNRIPWLAFGSGTVHRSKDVSNLIRASITRGFTHIDTAQGYQNEQFVGEGLKASGAPREEFYVTTKLARLNLDGGESETVEDTLRRSLEKLGLEYVDLFLVHSPIFLSGRLKAVWKGMIDVKKKGLAKSIGVSNFGETHLREILEDGDEPPAVNQIEYHPWLSTSSRPLLEFQAQHGIITASYGGLSPILPHRAGDASLVPARERLVAVLDKLASNRGENVTRNQILLKWLQHRGVLAVTTSSKESRIDEYLATESLADFTPEEAKEFDEAVEGVYLKSFVSRNIRPPAQA